MNVTVRIDDQTYEVAIENLSARPVIAVVGGRRFEVWPEDGITRPAPAPAPPARPDRELERAGGSRVQAAGNPLAVYAPIPGVIVEVSVRPGEVVSVGQELCMLEAMKMKNAIRAARSGELAAVHVTPGQHVKHHDLLIEYAG